MAIVNRDLDSSQQRIVVNAPLTNTITGQTYALMQSSWPGQVIAAQIAGIGLSGSPNCSLWIQRFNVGSGVTTFSLGNSLVLGVFGTSGPQGFSLPNGPSFLLQAGDLVTLATSAANTGSINTTVTLVVRALQDIKTDFGV